MKKLVAIALVLAMATMASAGLGFVVQGNPATVNPGDVLTINLIASGAAVCNGYNFDALTDGGAGGVATLGTFNAGLTALSGGYLENTPAGILIDYVTAYATAAGIASGNNLYSFQYTVGSQLGLVTIAPVAAGVDFFSVLDQTTYTATAPTGDLGGVTTPIDGVTFNVVPEPMTLGLLGLGGLFLRRRLA